VTGPRSRRRIRTPNSLHPIARYKVYDGCMHIKQLAGCAGVNIQTIRFYEKEGLLPRPQRSASGYRIYEPNDVERVSFIKRNQELGFTLAEIKQLVQLHAVVASTPKPIRRKPKELQAIIALGGQRLRTIEDKIRSLRVIKRQLMVLLSHLQAKSVMGCPAAMKRGSKPSKSA
jgi:DNA-binding transcriptional MerR regulator